MCEYCEGVAHIMSKRGFTVSMCEGNSMQVEFSGLVDYWNSVDECADVRINFCPMCGRKLEARECQHT